MQLIRAIPILITISLSLTRHYFIVSQGLDNYDVQKVRADIVPKETHAQKPSWYDSAYIAASLVSSQHRAMGHFVKSEYARRHGSNFSAFGINWALGADGSRHATSMRSLLLTAGDIESNPGPVTPAEEPSISQQNETTEEPSSNTAAQDATTTTHQCSLCDMSFHKRSNLTRHCKARHPEVQSMPTPQYTCQVCGKTFSRRDNLRRHEETLHASGSTKGSTRTDEKWQVVGDKFECPTCHKTFDKKCNLKRHLATPNIHQPKSNPDHTQKFPCPQCGKEFSREANLTRHQKIHERKRTQSEEPDRPKVSKKRVKRTRSTPPQETTELEHIDQTGWETLKRHRKAFRGDIASYRTTPGESARDPSTYLKSIQSDIKKAVQTYLSNCTGIKLQLCLQMKFFKPTNTEETCQGYFWSLPEIMLEGDDIDANIQTCYNRIIDLHDTFVRAGSGWVDDHVTHLDIHFIRYQPLTAGCAAELPKRLRDTKGALNIQSKDDKCFLWCIAASDHVEEVHKSSRNRVENYKKYEGGALCVHLLNVATPACVRINIEIEIEIEKGDYDVTGIRFPMELNRVKNFEKLNNVSINVFGCKGKTVSPRYISKRRDDKHVNLLLHQGHYFLITDLDRLLSSQRKNEHKGYYCQRCLFPTYSQDALEEHLRYCRNEDPSITKMAKKDHLKFENTHRSLRRPLVVYADFECLTEKIEEDEAVNKGAYQHHLPCGYGLMESRNCCGNPTIQEPRGHRGEDCVEKFLHEPVAIGMEHQENPTVLKRHRKSPRPLPHVWTIPRGCTSGLQFNYRLDRDVTVVFHNLRKYDSHLIMQSIGQAAELFGMKLNVVAKSMEDYLTFSLEMPSNKEEGTEKWRIRFIDSYQFLTSSLDNLAKALPKDKFHALKEFFNDQDKFDLISRKGVYPYDYMDKWERFLEKELPAIEEFYSQLMESGITAEDYEHAKKVWKIFNIENMGDYHDLYLQTDVMILHDVFEEFRSLALKHYGLDPTHYITLPSMAWDACLKKTDVKLELLQDCTMYNFIEKGIRGGISVITKRYARANNELCEGYDETKPKSYIMYNDVNNLYGWAMIQKLPTDGFRWMTEDEIASLTTDDFAPNQDKGYILEVDLDYPSELHDSHSDYPLAAERLVIDNGMLSPFCRSLKEDLAKDPEVKKLVPNLMNKRNYVIHSWQLHLCLELGLKLRKIHKAIEFNQSEWMKPYILLNTELRKQVNTTFEKDLFKLMNNTVFGKTMENTRLYQEIQLVTTQQKARKVAKSPRFKQLTVFNNLVAMAMAKKYTRLDKPIHVGFSVLEISKICMYEFHYKHMVPLYGDRLQLLFTDTDSFMYHITTDNVYADMKANIDMYDASAYPQKGPRSDMWSPKNNKVLGKMKDETDGVPIEAFVGLKSKMYSYIVAGKEKKRAKGIKKVTVDKHVTFAQYLEAVQQHTRFSHDMHLIRSILHELYSLNLTKVSLTPYDDKRYITEKGIETLAYGHYRTDELEATDIMKKIVEEIEEDIEMDVDL